MTNEDFLKIIEERHEQCLETLKVKADVYASMTDRLHNFKDAAAMNSETSQEALWGMVSKHIIATKDMVKSDEIPNEKWIKEYLGDIINYMYLLEATWKDLDTPLKRSMSFKHTHSENYNSAKESMKQDIEMKSP